MGSLLHRESWSDGRGRVLSAWFPSFFRGVGHDPWLVVRFPLILWAERDQIFELSRDCSQNFKDLQRDYLEERSVGGGREIEGVVGPPELTAGIDGIPCDG